MAAIGLNISHNLSLCVKQKDKIQYWEEDRFNKIKNYGLKDALEILLLESKIKDLPKDIPICFTTIQSFEDGIDKFCYLFAERHNIPMDKWFRTNGVHHDHHAYCGFYNSNFDDALVLVMDGGGAQQLDERIDDNPLENIYWQKPWLYVESDSIYYIDKYKLTKLYKRYSTYYNIFRRKSIRDIINTLYTDNDLFNYTRVKDGVEELYTSLPGPGMVFIGLCAQITGEKEGFDAGKMMGLSSYGKVGGDSDEDLCKEAQIATEKYTMRMIEKALDMSTCRNLVLTGGYAMNCVNNYKYAQHFKGVNFFVDPVPHDGGTAIGAAVWLDDYFQKSFSDEKFKGRIIDETNNQ